MPVFRDNQLKFPRAVSFLEACSKTMILSWLKESEIGQSALGRLERRLIQPRKGKSHV